MSGEKDMTERKFDITTVIMIVCLVMASVLFFYPRISNIAISHYANREQRKYNEDMSKLSEEEKNEKISELTQVNEELASRYTDLNDPFYLGAKEGDGKIMETRIGDIDPIASIAIPNLNIFLSIYEGTDPEILKYGAGHMKKSSYPIGGLNTHSIITAHTGFHSAKLFTDLDKIKIKDKFYIKNLNGILAYEVVEINTVLPNELQYLKIQKDRDLVTLMTCTPEGLNTHRLLVLGERIPYTPNLIKEYEKGIEDIEKETKKRDIYTALGVIVSITIIFFLTKRVKKRVKND